MIRVLQININGIKVAQDLMESTACRVSADVLIISEPRFGTTVKEGWFADAGNKAAVVIANPTLPIMEVSPQDKLGYRWVKIKGIRFYACYWSPNTDFSAFSDFLDRLERSVREAAGPVIIAGDFNAKSPTKSRTAMKYLGVVLQGLLSFKAHLETTANRSAKTVQALARLMPNVGGPGQKKMQLLATVIQSQTLYASPARAGSFIFHRNVHILSRLQRTIAIRVARVYRTVSTQAVKVIASIIPVHLLAWVRQQLYEGKKEIGTGNQLVETREEVFRRW